MMTSKKRNSYIRSSARTTALVVFLVAVVQLLVIGGDADGSTRAKMQAQIDALNARVFALEAQAVAHHQAIQINAEDINDLFDDLEVCCTTADDDGH